MMNSTGDDQMAGYAHEHSVLLSVSSVPASIHFCAKKRFVGPRECARERLPSVFTSLRRLGAFIHVERCISAIIRHYLTYHKLSSLKILAGEEHCV